MRRALKLQTLLLTMILLGCSNGGDLVDQSGDKIHDERAPSNTRTSQQVNETDEIDFDAFLANLYNAPTSARQEMVEAFIAAIGQSDEYGFPLTYDDRAVYLYLNADAQRVTVVGDHNSWSPDEDVLARVSGTNMWYRRKTFPTDARLDFKFVVDGDWILDPRCEELCYGGYGPNSVMAMPEYVFPEEVEYDSTVAHGTVEEFTFESELLGNSRTVRIYTPFDYDPNLEFYPVLYVHDGGEYVELGAMVNVLDNLIGHSMIEPVIVVFVDPVDRMVEYWRNADFMEMFVTELIPHVEEQYEIETIASRRGVMGCSLGGITSLYFGLHHPEVFGLVAGHSSALWIDEGVIVDNVELADPTDIQYYFDTGTFEGDDYLRHNRRLRDILIAQGNNVVYKEWNEAHSWGNWRAHIDEILLAFFYNENNSVPE